MDKEMESPLLNTILTLENGLNSLLSTLESKADPGEILNTLRESVPLITQLKEWIHTMPADRIQSMLDSVIISIHALVGKALRENHLTVTDIGATESLPFAPFITEIVYQQGPELVVSADQMVASISISDFFAPLWTPEKLQEVLTDRGVVGMNPESLKKAIQQAGTLVPVASGQEPESGGDAVMTDVLGLTEFAGKPTIMDNQNVNYKELNLFINISKGQILLSKKAATPGVPGVTVFGEPLPCRDGVDIPFPAIPNTEISEDQSSLLSLIDGCAFQEGGQLRIVPTLEIKQNVDFSVGNIDSSVAIHVKGDVLTGFRVESLQDIIVKGTAEGCKLLSKGNIFLPGGVQGKNESLIQARKNVDAKFLNEAKVIAEQSVLVHGGVILSHVRCHRLQVDGKDAEIKGGLIEAALDVCADSIGADIGAKTDIQLGYDLKEIELLIEKNAEDIQLAAERVNRFQESLDNIQRFKAKNGSLPPDKEKLLEKVETSLNRAQENLSEKEKAKEALELELERSHQSVRMVRARKQIYPGVEISILDHTITFKQPTGPAIVLLVDQELQVLPFQERNFEEEEDQHIE